MPLLLLLLLAVRSSAGGCPTGPDVARLLEKAPPPQEQGERFYEALDLYLTCGAATGRGPGCGDVSGAVFGDGGQNSARRCRRGAGILAFQKRLSKGEEPTADECARWVGALELNLDADASRRLCRLRGDAHRAGFHLDFCWRFAEEFRPGPFPPEFSRQFCMELAYPVYGCDEPGIISRRECEEWNAATRASRSRDPRDCGGRPLCLAALFGRAELCRKLAEEAAEELLCRRPER